MDKTTDQGSGTAGPVDCIVRRPANEGTDSAELAMKPMVFEDGRRGWYIDHPDFYCEIELDSAGVWSVFFRDNVTGQEAFAERKTPNGHS